MCVIIVLGSAISFDSLLNTVHVLSTTKPGSIVANLTLLIDEAALNSSYYMAIYKYSTVRVYHNESGWINPHLSKNINSLFELTSSTPAGLGVTDGNINRLIFKNSAIQYLRMTSPVKCVTDTTKYIAVSFGLRLLSDSLYHLGDHLITIYVSFRTRTNSYYIRQYVQLTVEAGMDCDKGLLFKFLYLYLITCTLSVCSLASECQDSTRLYDFVHHRCVSACSCGYTPFRSHTTAYCEAGLHTVYKLYRSS